MATLAPREGSWQWGRPPQKLQRWVNMCNKCTIILCLTSSGHHPSLFSFTDTDSTPHSDSLIITSPRFTQYLNTGLTFANCVRPLPAESSVHRETPDVNVPSVKVGLRSFNQRLQTVKPPSWIQHKHTTFIYWCWICIIIYTQDLFFIYLQSFYHHQLFLFAPKENESTSFYSSSVSVCFLHSYLRYTFFRTLLCLLSMRDKQKLSSWVYIFTSSGQSFMIILVSPHRITIFG